MASSQLFPALNSDELGMLAAAMGPVELASFAQTCRAARSLAFERMGCTLERLSPVMIQGDLIKATGISPSQAKALPYDEVFKWGFEFRNVTHVFTMRAAMPVLVANIGWPAIAACIAKRKRQDAKLAELNERRGSAVS